MLFIKAKSSQASGWGWMLSMLAFPFLFHSTFRTGRLGTTMGRHTLKPEILQWTHGPTQVNVLPLSFFDLIPFLGRLLRLNRGRRPGNDGLQRPLIGPYLLRLYPRYSVTAGRSSSPPC